MSRGGQIRVSLDTVWFRWFVGYAIWFYGQESFPLLQLFWPDRKGAFPWEVGADDGLREAQPRLHEGDRDSAGVDALLKSMREGDG